MRHRNVHPPHRRPLPRGFVPMVGAPWLTLPPSVRPLGYVLVGTLGCFLGINAMGAHASARNWHTLVGVMVFLLVATLIGAFGVLGVLAMRGIQRGRYQWCPDCLQYRTRGARVCPFCGLHTTPGEPDVPSSRSSQRTDAAHP